MAASPMDALANLIAQQSSISKQYGGAGGIAPNLVNIQSFLHGGVSDQQQLDQMAQNNPLIKSFQDAGAIGFKDGNWNVDWDKINSMLPKDPYGQTAEQASPVEWEQPGTPGSHISSDASGNPMINASSYGSDAIVRLRDPSAVKQSDYGWTTPAGNFHVYPKVSGMENFMTSIIPILIAGGLGAGFGSLTGLGGLTGLLTKPPGTQQGGSNIPWGAILNIIRGG